MASSSGDADLSAWAPLAVLAVFASAALLFWLDPLGAGEQTPEPPRLKAAYYDTASVRPLKSGLMTAGAPCGQCHDSMAPPDGDPRKRGTFHDQIVLRHGMNVRCFNCHNREKRDFFVAHGGEPIPYSRVETLCAKCHGPHYRDWLNGAHGRRSGYWNTAMGERRTLVCIGCHDPHWPVFKPLLATPAPRALRATEVADKR